MAGCQGQRFDQLWDWRESQTSGIPLLPLPGSLALMNLPPGGIQFDVGGQCTKPPLETRGVECPDLTAERSILRRTPLTTIESASVLVGDTIVGVVFGLHSRDHRSSNRSSNWDRRCCIEKGLIGGWAVLFG